MSRILFVTVGTTALYAKSLPQVVPADRRLRRDIDAYRDDTAEKDRVERAERLGLRPRVLEAHRKFWHGVKETQPAREHYHRTSAELITTFGLLGASTTELSEFFQREGDEIVLLASNTEEGGLAAHINAEILHERLRGTGCECGANPRICKRLVVETVRGMETATGFENLKDGLLEIVARYEGAEAIFNITGGYKGVIPYITWLTLGKFRRAPMYYQHEHMSEAIRIEFEEEPGLGTTRAPVLEARSAQLLYIL